MSICLMELANRLLIILLIRDFLLIILVVIVTLNNEINCWWIWIIRYYFCMGAAVLVAVTVLVYIQDNVGWGLGLGIPTVAMFLSVIAFVGGFRLYRHLDPSGSPFTRLIQVATAAFRKRKLRMVSDPTLLYFNDEIDAPISLAGKLTHTKHMR